MNNAYIVANKPEADNQPILVDQTMFNANDSNFANTPFRDDKTNVF